MSRVLRIPAATPQQSLAYLQAKLAYYTDAWDLAGDLRQQLADIVVIDARAPDAYRAGHICGTINFPHRGMDAETTARLDRSKVYVTYCDGIGCNGSTKAALKLASLGFQVKELIGGLDFWKRDGHPLTWGGGGGRMARYRAGGILWLLTQNTSQSRTITNSATNRPSRGR